MDLIGVPIDVADKVRASDLIIIGAKYLVSIVYGTTEWQMFENIKGNIGKITWAHVLGNLTIISKEIVH